MKPEPIEISVELSGGKNLKFETGKIAKQAHGSSVVRIGDNVLKVLLFGEFQRLLQGIDSVSIIIDGNVGFAASEVRSRQIGRIRRLQKQQQKEKCPTHRGDSRLVSRYW